MGLWGFGGGPVGLIAGSGDYPGVLAQAFVSQKKKIILIGVEGLTDKSAAAHAAEAHYIGLGDLDKLLKILTDKKIKQIVLAGGIPKKEIHNPSFKTDSQASDFMKGIRNKGDDHLIRAFGMYLKVRCGASILDPRKLLKDVLAPKGVLTRRQPSEAERADIKFGFRISKEIGRMDIGQTVVVRSGIVLAVEAIEGTNQALRRGAELGCGEAVAVKTSKPKQDLRFDLPCVGIETVRVMAESGVRVLAVEAGKTLLLGKEAVLRAADEKDLTLVGI